MPTEWKGRCTQSEAWSPENLEGLHPRRRLPVQGIQWLRFGLGVLVHSGCWNKTPQSGGAYKQQKFSPHSF